MIKLKDLLNEGPKEMVSKIDKIAKKELGNKVFAIHFRDNI